MAEEYKRGEWNTYAAAVDEKLELRLGLPGGEHWSPCRRRESFLLILLSLSDTSPSFPRATTLLLPLQPKEAQRVQLFPKRKHKQLGFRQSQAKGTDSFQKTNGNTEQQQQQSLVGKSKNSTIVQIDSHSRIMAAPVVGWPPIRSFRKNLAGAAKLSIEFQNGNSKVLKKCENERKCLFVKINMDGIPIGRKVDLLAYDSYDKLSMAVDELFRDLMAEKLVITTGLLDGSGENTLVYEDDEGDEMLVGDVPWEMFVSSAKRLRVLKSCDLSASSVNVFVSGRGRKARANVP
ncbi:auxin-responsive protein IAA16-like [Zingiber officinale]|uniref:auxin-responsive protein IAA16-like n=1 Tax=Zingiber officinale TaxID=94328 RepID=UPI001C4D3A38|nr:auxin-responsive protein IAA16-like [Zingiber officinale]